MPKSQNESITDNFKLLVEKADQLKKQNPLDLSSDQDLSIAIMHLISIEEHFIFTGAKTNKTKYYDLIKDIREMRKKLMEKIVKDPEGEVWCISKHLLGSSMRLIEVGTKQQTLGNTKEAYSLFDDAYELYSLFWGLNLNLIKTDDIATKNQDQKSEKNSTAEKKSFPSTLGGIIKKVVNCCLE